MSGISYKIATSVVLPFKTQKYGSSLEEFLASFKKRHQQKLMELNVSLTTLELMVKKFKEHTIKFDEKAKSLDKTK
jgi:hypothetical protein